MSDDDKTVKPSSEALDALNVALRDICQQHGIDSACLVVPTDGGIHSLVVTKDEASYRSFVKGFARFVLEADWCSNCGHPQDNIITCGPTEIPGFEEAQEDDIGMSQEEVSEFIRSFFDRMKQTKH